MPSEKQFMERKENISSILECLRVNSPKSRRQLAQELDLSWGCISELVSILLDKNIVVEQEAMLPVKKGRKPSLLTLNSDICFLGIDINRMGLKASICNLYGKKIVNYDSSLDYSSKSALINSVIYFTDKIRDKHPNIFGIGFAMQGIHNLEDDIWLFPGGKEIRINFKKDFVPKIDIPFVVEHDPDCILYGCIDNKQNVSKLLLRLDRGIGAVMLRGKSQFKESLMEVGYMVVGEKGERLHEVASLSAVEEKIGMPLSKLQNLNESKVHFETAGKYLGTALGNICNLLPVDEIILCGEMVLYYDYFSDIFKKYYQKAVLPAQKANISVMHITDAALGAAKLAMKSFGG